MDARGDLYVAEVTWSAGGNRGLVSPDCPSLQKFVRVSEQTVANMKHCLNRPLSFGREAVILKRSVESRHTSTFLRPVGKRPISSESQPLFLKHGFLSLS